MPLIDKEWLAAQAAECTRRGFQVARYLVFSDWALSQGLRVYVHMAVTTRSKYVYVSWPTAGVKFNSEKQYKVRFSNHKASRYKEKLADANFYVGHGNKGITTTDDAIAAVCQWAGLPPESRAIISGDTFIPWNAMLPEQQSFWLLRREREKVKQR